MAYDNAFHAFAFTRHSMHSSKAGLYNFIPGEVTSILFYFCIRLTKIIIGLKLIHYIYIYSST